MRGAEFTNSGGQRPDQFRAREVDDTSARIARAIVASPRFPFVGAEQSHALKIEILPGNGGTWFFVDAISAGTVFGNPDPRIIPPDQQASLINKMRAEGSVLASGQFGRQGLTTVPREDETKVAAMYRAQLTGNGSGPRDMTGFFAVDRLSDVSVKSNKTGEMTPATVIVGATIARNVDLEQKTRLLDRMGYGKRESDKRNKTKTNRRR